MFGFKTTESIPLIDLTFTNNGQVEPTISMILEKAQEIRQKYANNKLQKQNINAAFKNKEAKKKKFEKGELVLHRQLQVSTGTASKWKPQLTGPYVIEDILPSERTAICQNIRSGNLIKAHFTNLTRYCLDDKSLHVTHPNTLPEDRSLNR